MKLKFFSRTFNVPLVFLAQTNKILLLLLLLASLTRTEQIQNKDLSETNPSSSSSSSTTINLQRLSRAHLEFALSLFQSLTESSNSATETDNNVVISPYSIATVLSQLWLGAGKDSRTFQQLEEILHYKEGGLSPEQVHEAFKSSLYTLDDPDYKNVVQSANGLFIQAGLKLSPSYDESLRKYYNTTIDELDFENGGSVAKSIINRWVAKATGGQVGKLLETPVPQNTKILLANALALRAYWNNSFDPHLTLANGYFFPSPNNRIQIPMMTGKFNALMGSSSELRCKLLELPFRGRRLSMFILLPDEEFGESESESERSSSGSTSSRKSKNLNYLEKNLNAETLKKLFSTLREQRGVQIKLPRLRIKHSAPLVDTLIKMGLSDLFDSSRANLSRISTEEELHVSSISHKTVLELREQGAQAAAITATEIQRTHDVGGKYFEVNRPFIFFIWDYHSGALLFIGRVSLPEPLLT